MEKVKIREGDEVGYSDQKDRASARLNIGAI